MTTAAVEPYRGGPGAAVAEYGSMAEWLVEVKAAGEAAQILAPTPFVPQSLRAVDEHGRPNLDGTVINVAAALLTGQELGLGRMGSLRSIDIIKGTPALRALAARALLQQRGHEIWVVESTKTRCIVRGRRAGSTEVQESVWTEERAKLLGLLGKDNWRHQPQSMLVARATGECARWVAADALLGLPYIAEEIEDGDVVDNMEVEITPAPVKRTAQRRARVTAAPAQVAEATDEPPLDQPRGRPADAPPVAPDEPPTEIRAVPHREHPPEGAVDAPLPPGEPSDAGPLEEPISKGQLAALHAALNGAGLGNDREAALRFYEQQIGHPVATSKGLTHAEAATVINELNRRALAKQAAKDDAPPLDDGVGDEAP